MKKLLLISLTIMLSMTVAASAMADRNGLYIGIRSGATEHNYSKAHNVDIKRLDSNVFMLSGSLGYRYNYYRTELEYVWHDKDKWSRSSKGGATAKLDFQTKSFMWNHFVDFLPHNRWSPYVGFGLGFTKMKYNDSTTYQGHIDDYTDGYNNTPTLLTWSVGGGLSVNVAEKFYIDAGYRYYDMGSMHKIDVTAHEYYGGLRYVF